MREPSRMRKAGNSVIPQGASTSSCGWSTSQRADSLGPPAASTCHRLSIWDRKVRTQRSLKLLAMLHAVRSSVWTLFRIIEDSRYRGRGLLRAGGAVHSHERLVGNSNKACLRQRAVLCEEPQLPLYDPSLADRLGLISSEGSYA